MSISPIPVKDVLNIRYIDNLYDVKIIDINGNEIYLQSNLRNDAKLDLSGILTGTYFLIIKTNGERYSKKIIFE